jgi:cyclase
VFGQAEAYLRWITELADQGMRAGATALDVARDADLGPFSGLLDPERLVGNLHRAYADLGAGPLGAPLDVVRVFGEMIQFNGGRLPECLA